MSTRTLACIRFVQTIMDTSDMTREQGGRGPSAGQGHPRPHRRRGPPPAPAGARAAVRAPAGGRGGAHRGRSRRAVQRHQDPGVRRVLVGWGLLGMHPMKARVVYTLDRRAVTAELKLERAVELLKREKQRNEALSAIVILALPAEPGVH